MVLSYGLDCYLSTKNWTAICTENKRTRFVWFYLLFDLLIYRIGDASNFDEYEEEPRKKICEFDFIIFDLILVRIATTEKFGKEFEEF
jgi:hypothetical protein